MQKANHASSGKFPKSIDCLSIAFGSESFGSSDYAELHNKYNGFANRWVKGFLGARERVKRLRKFIVM